MLKFISMFHIIAERLYTFQEKTNISRVKQYFLLTVNFIYSWVGNYGGLSFKVSIFIAFI